MNEEPLFAPDPTGVLDEYDFGQVVEHGLAPFAQKAPEVALPLAIELLDRALTASERPALVARREDHSELWRSALDHPEQYPGSHARASLLVDVVRDTTVAIARKDRARVPELMGMLEDRGWPLFHRLALHLLLEVPDAALIRDRILDPDELARDLREHDRLVRAHFRYLSEQDRERYVELVEQRPLRTTYASGTPIDAEESERWLAAWRLRRLRAVATDLPARARARYSDIVAASPQPTRDEDEWVTSDWVREPPKLGADVLATMPMPEILEHLRRWQPTGGLMGPTISSQADALREATKSDPTRFGGHAAEFRVLEPTYVRALFAGLTDVVKEGAAIAWAPALELAAWVVEQPRDEAAANGWERDPGWGWTRRQISDLIGEGLRARPGQIPLELRSETWSVLSALADDDPASSVLEDGREPDPVMAALNSNRAQALQAVITYLDWVRRQSPDPSAPALRLAPEALPILDRHVDPALDPSVATRGAFGMRLVNLVALDQAWTVAHRDELFPYGSAPRLAKWTWDAYVTANRPFSQLLSLFGDDYAKAVDRIPAARPEGHLESERHLAEHLVIFYLWGRLDLDDLSSPLRRFYDVAPTWIRTQAMSFAGRVMKDSELDDDQCERLRTLWEQRRDAVGMQAEEHAELVEFGWWFIAEHCDAEWRLLELVRAIEIVGAIEPDSLVLEKLAAISPQHPVEALRAVELLVAAPRERWFISANLPEIERVLRAAIAAPETNERGVALANRLASAGYTGLLALLD